MLFLCVKLGHTDLSLSVKPENISRCHRFHCREDNLPLVPARMLQLHSMILVLYQHHNLYASLLCDSRTKPILTHTPEDPFLEIDVKGGENTLKEGREESHAPDAWCSRGEKSHVFKRGKTCLCHDYVI